MPPKNKNTKNAMTFYIETTLRPELQRQGLNYRSIADMIHIAIPKFKELSAEEKARYEKMAKEYKKQNRNEPDNMTRRDNTGTIIGLRVNPKEELERKRQSDRRELSTLLPADSSILREKFYIADFQYLVRTSTLEDEGEYLPLEIGVVEWCMFSGIMRTFHRFINPGDVTHRISPDEYEAMGESDLHKLWRELEMFINPERIPIFPPLYCMRVDYNKMLGCLEFLHDCAGVDQHSHDTSCRIKIQFLEDLTNVLYARKGHNLNEASIIDMLLVSTFDYEQDTRCEFHVEADTKHCALACPKRLTYAMSDSLSNEYGFELTPKHLPTIAGSRGSIVVTAPPTELIAKLPNWGNSSSSNATKFSGRGQTVVRETPNVVGASRKGFASRDIRYSQSSANLGGSRDTRDDYDDSDDDDFPVLGSHSVLAPRSASYSVMSTNSAHVNGRDVGPVYNNTPLLPTSSLSNIMPLQKMDNTFQQMSLGDHRPEQDQTNKASINSNAGATPWNAIARSESVPNKLASGPSTQLSCSIPHVGSFSSPVRSNQAMCAANVSESIQSNTSQPRFGVESFPPPVRKPQQSQMSSAPVRMSIGEAVRAATAGKLTASNVDNMDNFDTMSCSSRGSSSAWSQWSQDMPQAGLGRGQRLPTALHPGLQFSPPAAEQVFGAIGRGYGAVQLPGRGQINTRVQEVVPGSIRPPPGYGYVPSS